MANGYQHERDEFIAEMAKEGMSTDLARKLLRYAQTLHRLAVAQCNGDWPADNGERKVEFCFKCESGFVPSTFKTAYYSELLDAYSRKLDRGSSMAWSKVKVCPDCHASMLVDDAMPDGYKAVFQGDPRGCVFKVQVPSGRTNDWAKEGICVPVRDR